VLDEIVDLSEPSSLLDILFQYIYPQRQPDLQKIEFGTLAELAESAEKYQLYSAMGVCKIFMELQIIAHPLEVLLYAWRHGYPELMDEAALLGIDLDLTTASRSLPPGLLVIWVKYYELWSSIMLELYLMCTKNGNTHIHYGKSTVCSAFGEECLNTLQRIGAKPASLRNSGAIFRDIHHCSVDDVQRWKVFVNGKVAAIPNFSAMT